MTTSSLHPLAVNMETGQSPGTSVDLTFGDRFVDAGILIVDDEPVNVDLLKVYLEDAQYNRLITTHDSREVFGLVEKHNPDVILIDLMMPDISGIDILEWRAQHDIAKRIPVIVLTANTEPEARVKALRLGATDFLNKPVDPCELLLRLHNVLVTKSYQNQLHETSQKLELIIRQRTLELEASRQEAIHCLARAAEYRDDDTGKHVIRVGKFSRTIALRLGISHRVSALLEQAAQLHDVGKIGIPDSILCKPGRLDPDEYAVMKRHCPIGRKIIQPLTDREWKRLREHTSNGADLLGVPSSPIMKMAAVIAQTHHEKWDGSGYPMGLSGEQIPLEGRIVAVADVFDALSSSRPYKPAYDNDKCFSILEEGRGAHFDPRVLDAFFDSIDEILKIKQELADAETQLREMATAT